MADTLFPSVAQMYQEYLLHAGLQDAPQEQRTELYRAFCAGMWQYIQIQSIAVERLLEKDALEVLFQYAEELKDFAQHPYDMTQQMRPVEKYTHKDHTEYILNRGTDRVVRIYVSPKKVTVDLSQVRDRGWSTYDAAMQRFEIRSTGKLLYPASTDVKMLLGHWNLPM